MKTSDIPKKKWRIAIVSLLRQMDAQHGLDGIYRKAEHMPEVWIRRFDAEANDFRRDVLTPLREWQPHGVMVRMTDLGRLNRLCAQFPSVPFVSMIMAPSELVHTIVAGDIVDSIAKIRDYLHRCGLSQMALFCLAAECAVVNETTAFRKLVPDGIELVYSQNISSPRTPSERERQRKMMTDGLLGLPKPVGIVTLETAAAPFLLAWCHKLGLRVPDEVQIIGLDEEDLCLACQPRLTSYVPPNRRIGEAAVETMLQILRKEQPPPPPIVRVSGGGVIPRGSTAMMEVGRQAVAEAIDRMQAHAAQGLTATDVTRLSKVGKTTFYEEFGETTGNTPAQYLRKMRIEEACRLLRKTEDTVTAIGKTCGFKSLQSFVNFFRRQTGQSPTEFRSGNKKKANAGKTTKRGHVVCRDAPNKN